MTDEERLQTELQATAAALSSESWEQGAYRRFQELLHDEQAACEFAELQLQHLTQLESDYLESPIQPREASAESAAGHRCLRLGLDYWFEAMNDYLNGADPDEVLEKAEWGSRYLLAVQVFEARVRESLRQTGC